MQAYHADDPQRFRQTNWLVICNGSADATADLRNRLNGFDGLSCVRVIHCRNDGYGAAVNRAMQETRAAYLLALNADLLPEPGFLRGLDRVIAGLRDNTDGRRQIGLVGFRLRNPDGSSQGSVGRFPNLWRVLAGLLRPRSVRKYLSMDERPADVDWVTGACFLASRDCWQALSGFDERFFMYYEDVDLCARAWNAGWKVRYEPSVSSRHLCPYHSRPISHEMAHWARRAMLIYFWKHRPWWEYQALTRIVLLECAVRKRQRGESGEHGWQDIEKTVRRLLADPAKAALDSHSLPGSD